MKERIALATMAACLTVGAAAEAPGIGYPEGYRRWAHVKTTVVGPASRTMVIVPLPCELKTSWVAGLNTAPSDPPASGKVVRMSPPSAWAGWCSRAASAGTGPTPT